MGDADEAITTPKPIRDDGVTAASSSRPDIDMINLSSQLTGMELMSSKPRRAKKRVKFCLPEGDLVTNCEKNGEYRRREVGEYIRAKRRVTTSCSKQTQDKDINVVVEHEAGTDGSSDKKGAYLFDIHEDNIILFKRRKQHDHANVNTNCATKAKTSSKKHEINKRTSKSNECLSRKKMKVVDDSCKVKYVLGDKQKGSDILKDFKAMEGKGLKQNKAVQKNSNKQNSTSPKSLYHKYKHNKLSKKTKSKCHRKPVVKVKAKLTANKLKMSKDAKRKKLVKKASIQCKKALKRKQKLKRKLAQKRKLAKKKLAEKKRMRKIKIIPIEREEEVSECLRVNLLKFLTFEKAYNHKYECCKEYCWDKWEELDIDDVIADFD